MRAFKNVAIPPIMAIKTVAIPLTIACKTAPMPWKIWNSQLRINTRRLYSFNARYDRTHLKLNSGFVDVEMYFDLLDF